MTAFRAVLPRFKELCVATICCDLKGQQGVAKACPCSGTQRSQGK